MIQLFTVGTPSVINKPRFAAKDAGILIRKESFRASPAS